MNYLLNVWGGGEICGLFIQPQHVLQIKQQNKHIVALQNDIECTQKAFSDVKPVAGHYLSPSETGAIHSQMLKNEFPCSNLRRSLFIHLGLKALVDITLFKVVSFCWVEQFMQSVD